MHRSGFTEGLAGLLFLLVVCSPELVRSDEPLRVTYSGDTWVKEEQPWRITCTIPKKSGEEPKIQWLKDESPANVEDFLTGSMHVDTPQNQSDLVISTLISNKMTAKHAGVYKCVAGSESHTLNIVHDVTTKVIGKNDTIELDCPEGVEKPQWKKGNSSLDLKSQFYMLVNDGATLQITHPPDSKSEFDSVYSNYSCVGEKLNDTKESAKYRVVRPPYVVMPESTIVIEGEKLHLTCAVKSYDSGLSIMWNFKNKNYHTDNLVDRIKLTKDEEKKIPNAVFHLSDVTKDDRVDITCTAYYNLLDLGTPQHVGTAKTLLRVKDKLAALWPFLGICAEVVILCAIILIYEKKRNKSELEESDTDQSPDTKPASNKDSDVRHRK